MARIEAPAGALNNRTLSVFTSPNRVPSSSTAPVPPSISSLPESHSDSPESTEKQPTHQRFVLTDPVAFRYLEEDPATHVLARREKLVGYECYLVEQWACARTHPTFIITTYTGDPAHTVIGRVLSVPIDEKTWSPRVKVYFRALDKYHARRRETPLGTLMVTNLSGFPSSLTVIVVPEGDVKSHREDFFVNENLKRLGCSGRVGLTMTKPTAATKAKFYQLYKASDKVPLGAAVIELVKLCQLALMLFGKLEPEYADGLLCDVTEKAINDWWIEFGSDYYNMEPHDGILGPTTVSALLGLISGARNRLHEYNAPIGKDVFDVESTKRAIAYFQKSQHIVKTRRLDRQTLSRLHRATAKAASGEGWLVPRAVKSTVAELSGKGGEMVMDMVAGRERVRGAGIADVETVDIEVFVHLIRSPRAKWLWEGKPWKGNAGDMSNRLASEDTLVFQRNEQGGYEWSRRKDGSGDSYNENTRTAIIDTQGRRDLEHRSRHIKKLPDRTPSHKTHDTSRGFGRIKDAVGLLGHSSKHPKDEAGRVAEQVGKDDQDQPLLLSNEGSSISKPADTPGGKNGFLTPDSGASQFFRNPIFTKILSETPIESPRVESPSDDVNQRSLGAPIQFDNEGPPKPPATAIINSTYKGIDLEELLPTKDMPDRQLRLHLRRRNSYSRFQHSLLEARNRAYWPRHCSFSIAEESLLSWESINGSMEGYIEQVSDTRMLALLGAVSTEDAKRVRRRLLDMETVVGHWVSGEVAAIQDLANLIAVDQDELNNLYHPHLEEFEELDRKTKDILESERSQLTEAIKEIEVLNAKLEYEMNALRSKIEDVEDGVVEFERQVSSVKDRVTELELDMRPKEGWVHFLVRLATGFGFVTATGAPVETHGAEI